MTADRRAAEGQGVNSESRQRPTTCDATLTVPTCKGFTVRASLVGEMRMTVDHVEDAEGGVETERVRSGYIGHLGLCERAR